MEDMYRNHIEHAIRRADRYQSKCPSHLLQMEGMSGKKTRHFYNVLCSLPNMRYLEIGTWRGSSLCSAICGNTVKGVAIDNWSYSGTDRTAFLQNLETYRGANDIKVLEKDCWDVAPEDIGMKFTIYLYDGDHTSESHTRALTHFIASAEDVFIYIVDDWNDLRVRVGTMNGISASNLRMCYQREIYTTDDNSHPSVYGPSSDWHNGICVFVLSK